MAGELKLGDHPLLSGAGKVQAKVAAQKIDAEYERWHVRAINAPNLVERHFVDATSKVTQIEAVTPKAARKGKGGDNG